jgi:putative GTP pyrophosphokinase
MINAYDRFISKNISKGDVRRAGQLLKRWAESSSEENFLEKDISHALEIAEYWRGLHSYPLNTFQPLLRKMLKRIASQPMLAQRLKRMPTMVNKLSRMDGTLETMQDIGGIRIIVNTTEDILRLESELNKTRASHEIKTKKDYIAEPKNDGYRGKHYVFRCYPPHAPDELQGLMIEIQIRTKLQHYWATALEAVDMFYGESLKIGQGQQLWKDFFLAASALFAFAENSPRPAAYENHSYQETVDAVRIASQAINAEDKMNGMTKLVSKLAKEVKNSKTLKYYLLIFSKNHTDETPTFRYLSYSVKEIDDAKEMYNSIDTFKRKSELAKHVDVVLVAASGNQLEQLYSNYLLEVSDFLKTLNKLMDAPA